MAISDIFDAEVITNGLKHKARTNSIPIAIAATVCRPASTFIVGIQIDRVARHCTLCFAACLRRAGT